jgi:hypothetical protein
MLEWSATMSQPGASMLWEINPFALCQIEGARQYSIKGAIAV